MKNYHDNEWGVPVHDDRLQFEFLCLEVMQCGISWGIVLKKREIIRECLDGFDFERISRYTQSDIERVLSTDGMIKNRKKIEAQVTNAECFIKIRNEFGSFSEFLWSFTDNKTIIYDRHPQGVIPAQNGLSQRVSAELKSRGFKFVGPIVMYSHLQACGLINDHGEDCPCFQRLINDYPTVKMQADNELGVVDWVKRREKNE